MIDLNTQTTMTKSISQKMIISNVECCLLKLVLFAETLFPNQSFLLLYCCYKNAFKNRFSRLHCESIIIYAMPLLVQPKIRCEARAVCDSIVDSASLQVRSNELCLRLALRRKVEPKVVYNLSDP